MRILLYAVAFAAIALSQTAVADADRDAGEFTVALIPDTQYYCDPNTGGTPEMYYKLTSWLKKRVRTDNIRFAIHLGDIVNNPNAHDEWIVADRAQKILHPAVPFSVLPGNHDLGSEDYYNRFFGPERFKGRPYYGGHQGTANNNNYCFFSGGKMDFMVLSLEYNPSEKTLLWAQRVLEAHPRRRIIVATHSYLALKGRKPEGERIWKNLISKNDRIFMVTSGHISGWNHQISTNDNGRPVIEILSDYQWEPDGLTHPPLGGDGWLNIMKFVPREDKIYFKSYSPYLNKWRRTELHEYTLHYEMP
ncbi:MAG: metallophosphoesterase [Pirellulales bacterium]|nr:metallophosphoesterase [Pirellulales bacterium]